MIFILGAGPTGIAVAHELFTNSNREFVLIDQGKNIGGLASTVNWEPHGFHDLGPHKIFSVDKILEKKVIDILGKENWIIKKKVSKIFLNGKLIDYPPSPFTILKTFGVFLFLKFTISFIYQKFYLNFKHKKIQSYKDHLISRVGSVIFEKIFNPITEKIWGDPSTLDKKLSETRVQLPSIFDMLLLSVGVKKKNSFEANEFIYPKNGLNEIWKKIQNNLKKKNLQLETKVNSFEFKNNKISKIHCEKNNNKIFFQVEKGDIIVNTLPIKTIQNSFRTIFGQSFISETEKVLKTNTLYLVFLTVDTVKLFDESWIFVPDKSIIFHRVSEQKSFDTQMVKKDRTIVCCEIMINKFNKNFSDKQIIDKTVKDLKIIKGQNINILDKKLIKLPNTYPVYEIDYEKKLKSILEKYDSIENFYTIGRQGSFNYIGTLDSMDIGFGFVKWMEGYSKSSWQDERKRTSEYPILD